MTREAADRVALDLLDACAALPADTLSGMRTETLTASVVAAIGTELASMVFDGGVPGSGQVTEAWRVGKRIVLTGDDVGAFGVSDNLNDVLAWWIRDWQYPVITGRGLNASLIEALGLVRSDDEDGSVSINGRIWRRQAAGDEP